MATETQPEVLEVTGDEVLSMFAQVMIEWGHYKKASGLTFPDLAEARRVAIGRRTDRGWNTAPIP